MWIFDSYFKGCLELWSRERGLERISRLSSIVLSAPKTLTPVKSLLERQGKTGDVQKIKKSHLEDEALKYHLHPIALGLFGGVWDKNKMGFLFRRTLGFLMKQFEAAGFKEISPGLIDTRDLEEIRKWTRELVQKVLQ